jgi:hypothetical protein
LEWVIVRPGGLTDGAKTGNAHIATDNSNTAGQVSRADVAALLLDELINPQAHLGKAVAISEENSTEWHLYPLIRPYTRRNI